MASLEITGDALLVLRFAVAFGVAAGSFSLVEPPLLRREDGIRARASSVCRSLAAAPCPRYPRLKGMLLSKTPSMPLDVHAATDIAQPIPLVSRLALRSMASSMTRARAIESLKMVSRKIHELVWPEDRVDHIARHGVTPEEVEEACFGRAIVQQAKSYL